MAHVLKTFDPPKAKGGRPCTHPWDKWFDGKTRELIRGKDFEANISTMEKFIRSTARKRGISITVYHRSPTRLVICPRQRRTQPRPAANNGHGLKDV